MPRIYLLLKAHRVVMRKRRLKLSRRNRGPENRITEDTGKEEVEHVDQIAKLDIRIERIQRAGRDERRASEIRGYRIEHVEVVDHAERRGPRPATAASKIQRQEVWKDIARLAHDRADNLVVKNPVASAYHCRFVSEQARRPRETDARRKVVPVSFVNL